MKNKPRESNDPHIIRLEITVRDFELLLRELILENRTLKKDRNGRNQKKQA